MAAALLSLQMAFFARGTSLQKMHPGIFAYAGQLRHEISPAPEF
jgi:hypothetical protein